MWLIGLDFLLTSFSAILYVKSINIVLWIFKIFFRIYINTDYRVGHIMCTQNVKYIFGLLYAVCADCYNFFLIDYFIFAVKKRSDSQVSQHVIRYALQKSEAESSFTLSNRRGSQTVRIYKTSVHSGVSHHGLWFLTFTMFSFSFRIMLTFLSITYI